MNSTFHNVFTFPTDESITTTSISTDYWYCLLTIIITLIVYCLIIISIIAPTPRKVVYDNTVVQCNHTTVSMATDAEYGFGSIMNNILTFGVVAQLQARAYKWSERSFVFGRYSDYFVPFHSCVASVRQCLH